MSTTRKGGTTNEAWTYPSPQMFYNALTRKNKLGDTSEADIDSVVAVSDGRVVRVMRKGGLHFTFG